MLINYLKTAWRNCWRHRSFSSISIVSLAVSLAVCLLLVLLLYNQYQFDRHHASADRIYRVVSDPGQGNYASSPAPLGPALEESYAGIEQVTRLSRFQGHALTGGGGVAFRGHYAEPSFFEIFDWPLRPGGAAALLEQPFHLVVTAEWADRVFGSENPVGQTVELEELGTFTVAGVLNEPPGPTHLQPDLIASWATVEADRPDWAASWESSFWTAYNYVLLEEGVVPEQLDSAFAALRAEHFPEAETGAYSFRLQSVTDIALGPLFSNEIATGLLPRIGGIFLIGLMLVVLLSACFTFTNLSLARAMERTQEVGVRKTVGAQRWQVVLQFLLEAVLLAILALIAALVLLRWLIPAFNALFVTDLEGFQLSFNLLSDPIILVLFTAVTLAIGLLAGLYPAWALSAPQPIEVLGGQVAGTRRSPVGRARLRRILLGVQMCLSLILVISTLIIYQQSNYMLEADFGFDLDRLLHVELQGASVDALTQQAEQLPGVESTAAISHLPLSGIGYTMSAESGLHERSLTLQYFAGPVEDVMATLGVDLIAGTYPVAADGASELVINETAARQLGFDHPEESVSTDVLLAEGDNYQITGVMHDFHVEDLFYSIPPVGIIPSSQQGPDYLLIRAAPERHTDILEHLEAVWADLDPVHAFAGGTHTELHRERHAPFKDVLALIAATTFFALLISALGMLGMAAYAAQARVKEVGIRKALGATTTSITALLSKEFLLLAGLAIGIGLPVTWLLNAWWLRFFAYSIEIGIWVFVVGMLLLLLITLGTAGVQSLRAAWTNPAEAIRNE